MFPDRRRTAKGEGAVERKSQTSKESNAEGAERRKSQTATEPNGEGFDPWLLGRLALSAFGSLGVRHSRGLALSLPQAI